MKKIISTALLLCFLTCTVFIAHAASNGYTNLVGLTSVADPCHAFDGVAIRSHGLPSTSRDFTTMSSKGGASNGLLIPYQFILGSHEDIMVDIVGVTGSPLFRVALVGSDFISTKNCTEYEPFPSAGTVTDVYSNMPSSGTLKLTGIPITSKAYYVWIFVDPNSEGSVSLQGVTVQTSAFTSFTTSYSPYQPTVYFEPENSVTDPGQYSLGDRDEYYYGMTTPGAPGIVTAIGQNIFWLANRIYHKLGDDHYTSIDLEIRISYDIYLNGVLQMTLDRPDGFAGNKQLSIRELQSIIVKHQTPETETYQILCRIQSHYCTNCIGFRDGENCYGEKVACKWRNEYVFKPVTYTLSFGPPPPRRLAYIERVEANLPGGRTAGLNSDITKCTGGAYTFNLKGPDPASITNITYQLPSGWSWNGTDDGAGVQSGKWTTSISIYPFTSWATQFSGIPGGILQANVTYIDGQVISYKYIMPSISAPNVMLDQTSAILCKNQGATLSVVADNVSKYTYQWGGAASGALNIQGGTIDSKLTIDARQWNTIAQTVVLTVKDKQTQCQTSLSATVSQAGWTYAKPYVGWGIPTYKGFEQAGLVNSPNIVSEAKGNIYYVGYTTLSANNIYELYTYQWNAVKSVWENYALSSKTNPKLDFRTSSNAIALTEDQNANRNLYYVGLDKNVYKIQLGTDTKTMITSSGNIVGGLYAVRNSSGVDHVIYVDNQKNLWHYDGQSVVLIDNSVDAFPSPVFIGNQYVYSKNGYSYLNQAMVTTADGLPVKASDNNYVPYVKNSRKVVYYSNNGSAISVIGQIDLISLKGKTIFTANANVHFMSVNVSTGVLYFNNQEGTVTQLYDQTTSSVVGGCSAPAWKSGGVYTAGMQVLYNQHLYQAHWWTNNEPLPVYVGSTNDGKEWGDLGVCANAVDSTKHIWQTTSIVSEASSFGSIIYSFPNTFYFDESGDVNMTYFNTSKCAPEIVRLGDNSKDELTATFSIVLWPNPAKDLYSLSFDLKETSTVYCTVISVTGDKVSEQNFGELSIGKQEVSQTTESLSNGMYYIKLYTDNGVLGVSKMIINK